MTWRNDTTGNGPRVHGALRARETTLDRDWADMESWRGRWGQKLFKPNSATQVTQLNGLTSSFCSHVRIRQRRPHYRHKSVVVREWSAP